MTKPINICLLPKNEQEAIQEDKRLWLKAHNLLRENARLKKPGFVERHLNDMPADMVEDFKRRLLVIKQNRKYRRK